MLAFDGWQFARDRRVLAGRLGVDSLRRLFELGCACSGVDYRLTGFVNERGKLALRIELSGTGEMRCERCLQPLVVNLSGVSELELADSEPEIALAEDDVDRVLATRDMNVGELVEDEAILLLPMVPKHVGCQIGSGSDDFQADEGGGRDSPFGVLAFLRKKGLP